MPNHKRTIYLSDLKVEEYFYLNDNLCVLKGVNDGVAKVYEVNGKVLDIKDPETVAVHPQKRRTVLNRIYRASVKKPLETRIKESIASFYNKQYTAYTEQWFIDVELKQTKGFDQLPEKKKIFLLGYAYGLSEANKNILMVKARQLDSGEWIPCKNGKYLFWSDMLRGDGTFLPYAIYGKVGDVIEF